MGFIYSLNNLYCNILVQFQLVKGEIWGQSHPTFQSHQ